MPNYQTSKIYAIRSHQTDDIYIGSTTLSLSARLGEHRRQFRYFTEGKGTKTRYKGCKSRDLLQYDDAYIELVEEFPCETKEQLLKREGEIIRSTFCCVNRCVSGRTPQEYKEENKEALRVRQHDYDMKRREAKKIYNKAYRERKMAEIKS